MNGKKNVKEMNEEFGKRKRTNKITESGTEVWSVPTWTSAKNNGNKREKKQEKSK